MNLGEKNSSCPIILSILPLEIYPFGIFLNELGSEVRHRGNTKTHGSVTLEVACFHITLQLLKVSWNITGRCLKFGPWLVCLMELTFLEA